MARTNNLTNFLTDVASAIKTKTGDSSLIPASQFDTRIANITTGHLDNTEYQEANDDLDDILEGSTPVTIYPPDWSKIGYENTPQAILDDFDYSKDIKDNWNSGATSLASKFRYNTVLKYMPLVDTSSATNMNSMFEGCSNLLKVPLLDTSKVTRMQSMFAYCSLLTTIPQFDTSKVTTTFSMFESCTKLKAIPQIDTQNVDSMFVMFRNCSNLEDVPVLNTAKVTTISQMFTGCSSLSNDSLNNIMQMCINAVSYTGTKKLKEIGITSTQATTCQGLSNYQAFLDAGWTTGY